MGAIPTFGQFTCYSGNAVVDTSDTLVPTHIEYESAIYSFPKVNLVLQNEQCVGCMRFE